MPGRTPTFFCRLKISWTSARESEAVLAKYDQGEQRPVVLLVIYPDGMAADRALRQSGPRFPSAGGRGERRSSWTDKKYFAAGLENGVVAAVWHGGGAAQALALLAAVRAAIAAGKK